MAYDITIAAVVKTLHMESGWSIKETANGINRLSCTLVSTDGSYVPALGATFIMNENGVRIYAGSIKSVGVSGLAENGLGILTPIECDDNNELAYRRTINLSIPSGNVKAALTALLPYSPGVSIDPAQVNGITLPALNYYFQPLTDALHEISVLSSMPWNIDYNLLLSAKTPSSTAAPFDATTANLKIKGAVDIIPAQFKYFNRVLMLGGDGQKSVTDAFIGNGVTTAFTLNYTMIDNAGVVVNGGATETLSAAGGGGTWTHATVSGTTTITRTSAPANLNAISIVYTAQLPVLKVGDNFVQQGLRGVIEKFYKSDSYDTVVLQALADAYVARGILEPRTVVYKTWEVGIHPGMTQTITVPGRGISGTWLVTDVDIHLTAELQVERTVTAIEGTLYTGSWLDDLDDWASGGSSSAAVTGSVTVISGGGVGGTGTVDKIAKWATTSTLGDSIFSESGTVGTVTGTLNVTGGLTAATQDQITRTGILVAGATGAGFTIALTTSTVTGNLSYARMPSGSGTWTAVPTISGILTLQSDVTVAGNAGTTTYASQTTGWRVTAAGEADFRYLFTDELYAKSFIADLEQALAGGQIITKSVTTLGAAFTVPAALGTATLTVNDLPSAPNMAVFVSGDVVTVRSFSRANGGLIVGDAHGTVSAYADQANGVQTWTFTRLSATHGGSLASTTVIPNDSIVLDFGTSGSGYYQVSAIDGTVTVTSIARVSTTATCTCNVAHGFQTGDSILISGATVTGYNGVWVITVTSAVAFTFTVSSGLATPAGGTILLNDINGTNAPYAQIITWTTSPMPFNQTLRARFGNLRGVTGTNGEYGMVAGTYAATGGQFFRASNSAFELHGIDLKLWDGSTNTVLIDHATPSIALGSPVPSSYSSGTGVWMGKDTLYKFRVGTTGGNRLAWDGTNLTLVSENLVIDSTGVEIQTPASLAAGYGFEFSSGFAGTNFYGMYAAVGAANRSLYLYNYTTDTSKITGIFLRCVSGSADGTISISADDTTDIVAVELQCTSYVNTATSCVFYGQLTIGAVGGSDPLHVQVSGTNVCRIDTNGDWRPEADNTRRVGLATHRYTLIRGVTITSGDIGFENGWTFTESYKVGIDEPGVALLNAAGEVMAFFGESGFHGKPAQDVDDLPHAITTPEERGEMDAHPELRVKGYADGGAIYKTAADVRPFPSAKDRRTIRQRRMM